MRLARLPILDAWQSGGPFAGDSAAHGRVTFELGWQLHQDDNIGLYYKTPVRRWLTSPDMPNDAEIEVPNVRTIQIDRSIDTDAQTCQITLYNTWMRDNLDARIARELGDPGYFTWNRGESEEAKARWGHEPNDWVQKLVPNTLLRTYQGYGGHGKSIAQALEDGNLVMTGVWLVDSIRVATGGELQMACRDMGKLLVEQHLYPPLVPNHDNIYPLQYCRWNLVHPDVAIPKGGGAKAASSAAPGHPINDSFEHDLTTYWQSTAQPSRDTPIWIEFYNTGVIDEVGIWPWGGPYTVYVSLQKDGEWIDPSGTGTGATAPGGGPPIIVMQGVNAEQNTAIRLFHRYDCDVVRLTFTYLMDGGDGFYGGVREFESREITQSLDTVKAGDGNYTDYADLVRDFALWSGFHDGIGGVLGVIENTGAYSDTCIPPETFDKKPAMDGINQIKQIVGYLVWVDDEGGLHFESPNWWQSGNFIHENGAHVEAMFEIDERLQMTDYTVEFSGKNAYSKILVTTDDPTLNAEGTICTEITPFEAAIYDGGLVKTLMLAYPRLGPAATQVPGGAGRDIAGADLSEDTMRLEETIWGKLISIHLWFSMRQGQVTCAANPLLQINDQVRIWERITSETFVHYVRGISSAMDLDAGTYNMTLTTHWLGEWPTPWQLDEILANDPDIQKYLERTESRSVKHRRTEVGWPIRSGWPPIRRVGL